MKKDYWWKWVWIPFAAVFVFLVYFAIAAVAPNTTHLSVSEDYALEAAQREYTSDEVGGEQVYYVSDNTQAMEIRLAMLEQARSSVILSTFDFNADEAGQELISALLHAADRGVWVRILVDGLSGALDFTASGWFQALANHDNVEIKIYNPLNILLPWQTMYRLHDKYVIVDDTMYLLGGRNSTDLFLGDYSDHENIDSEVLVRRTEHREGDSLDQLMDYFDRVWNLEICTDYLGADAARGSRRAAQLEATYEGLPQTYPDAFDPDYLDRLEMLPTHKITLLSNPVEAVNKAPELWYSLTTLMARADEVYAVTPYVILSEPMKEDLAWVCSQTDSVYLMLNDVTSGANPWGCVDYLNERDAILDTGLTAAEYLGENSLHTKNVLLDDNLSVIGSFNFDMRSTYLDTELMLVIDSQELNAQLKEKAQEDLAWCRLVSLDGEEAGPEYVPAELSGSKAVIYQILRRVVIPVRCIL